MKLYRLRLGLGIAALFLSAGCYETGAMSVKTPAFSLTNRSSRRVRIFLLQRSRTRLKT